MIEWYQGLILALIQGLTEFLPISSSAHLILPSQVLNWPDQGLAFDVAVHVGTLAAVLVYFRQDVVRLTHQWIITGFSRAPSDEGRLAWYVIVATLPAAFAGLLLDDYIEAHLRSTLVIAITTIGFGVLLGLSDRVNTQSKTLVQMSLMMALIIGLSQALALIPGTSRSGITMTAALFLGLQRVDAARFSFLLSIPLILAAGGLKFLQLLSSSVDIDWSMLLFAVCVSAMSAWICIHYFLSFIQSIGMLPFVVYRLLLGIVLLAFFV